MQAILDAVLPVFVIVGFGFWLAKRGKPFHAETIAFLSSNIGTPALIVSSLAKISVASNVFGWLALASLICLAGFAIIGIGVLKFFRLPLKTYLPSLIFANTANLGIPVALFAYGQTGLGYAVIVFVVVSIANVVIGQSIAAGKSHWKNALMSPMVGAVIIGVLAATFHVQLPGWIDNTLSMLGALTIPLMLLMLGTSLAKFRVRAATHTVLLSLLRIGMGAGVGFAVAYAFGFTGIERAVLVQQCAMPVAVYNYLFSVLWDTEPEEVAALVVTSTLISMVTIPLLLAVLM